MAGGIGSRRSYYIWSQEAEGDECCGKLALSGFIQDVIPDHGW